jgi:subtilisin family serine protease
MGGHVLKELPLVNGMVVLLPSQSAVVEAAGFAQITRVEADVRVHALKPPGGCDPWPSCKDDDSEDETQPSETLEWGVDRIDAELVWDASPSAATGVGVDVAVVDTGIDQDHADLIANIAGGINFVEASSGPPWARTADPAAWDDDNGHGTHVAGIVGAVDNDIGVIGTAQQTNLWGVKVLDKNGAGYLSDVIDGITWSINNDMEVINMSLGTTSDSPSLHDAVDAAYDAGVVVVAAAGNSGDGDGSTNDVEYPAKYDSVIAVAATSDTDSTPSWSSEGAEIEVAAPGVDVRSTWNDGGYHTISGTSMASPHTAGVVALLLSADGTLSPAEVRAKLQATADDLGASGFDVFYGYGLVDAEEAVIGK